jgi:hypothetical protein
VTASGDDHFACRGEKPWSILRLRNQVTVLLVEKEVSPRSIANHMQRFGCRATPSCAGQGRLRVDTIPQPC